MEKIWSDYSMKKLSKLGEELLNEILEHRDEQGNCDLNHWKKRFDGLDFSKDVLLRNLFMELKKAEMISVNWADNIPYTLAVLSNGIQYFEMVDVNQKMQNNINYFYGEVKNVQIQQGTRRSKQTQNSNQTLDYETINELIKTVYKYSDMLEMDYGLVEATQLRKAIDELSKEMAEKKSLSKINGILNYIKELSVNAGGGLIASGILELIGKITR